MHRFFHWLFPHWVNAPQEPPEPTHREILHDAIAEANDLILASKLRVIRENGVLTMQEYVRDHLIAEYRKTDSSSSRI